MIQEKAEGICTGAYIHICYMYTYIQIYIYI